MEKEEILRKIYFYTEEQIYDCDIWMMVAEHSDISSSRPEAGGRWSIYEMAQSFDDLDELKSQLVLWREKFSKKLESLPKNYTGTMIDLRNDKAEIGGKIFACDDLLEYIAKLEA